MVLQELDVPPQIQLCGYEPGKATENHQGEWAPSPFIGDMHTEPHAPAFNVAPPLNPPGRWISHYKRFSLIFSLFAFQITKIFEVVKMHNKNLDFMYIFLVIKIWRIIFFLERQSQHKNVLCVAKVIN